MVLPGVGGPKIRVQPVTRPDGRREWVIKTPFMGRPSPSDTKQAAVDEARRIAKKKDGQLIIYDTNLNIQRTRDYS